MKEETEVKNTKQKAHIDIYESVKQFFNVDEGRYNRICNYLSDRLSIEYNYSKEMEKLSKKYMNSDSAYEKTVDKVITKFAEYDSIVCSEHDKFRSYLNISLEELSILKKNQDIVFKQLKDNIKPVARYHLELASTGIPKSKSNYLKKVEQEKENTETKNSSKIYKLSKDVAAAEHAYRVGITHLEEARLQLYSTRDATRQQYEALEKERNTLLQKIIKQYSRLQQRMIARFDEEYKPVFDIAQSINPIEDTYIGVKSFMQTWKIADKVYFEHYKNKLPAKDMVFGVPLSIAARGSPDYLPKLLPKCFEAIEKRGLDRINQGIDSEGIYRIAARVSDVTELKIACETSLDEVNLLDDSIDINAIAGLVKMYLRELPDPLLIFPAKERFEYSLNMAVSPPATVPLEERLAKLKFRIKTIPKEKEAVLRALLQHLNIIISHSAVNKMPAANIAMIFSAVIFHSQQDIPQEKENKSWFGKHSSDHQDIAYGMIKADSVFEDLLTNYDELFSIPLDKKAFSNTDISSKKSSMKIIYDLPPELPKRFYQSNDDLSKLGKEEMAVSVEDSINAPSRQQSREDVPIRKHSRDDLQSKGNLFEDDEMDAPAVPEKDFGQIAQSPLEKEDDAPYSPSNLDLPSPARVLAPVEASSPLHIPDLNPNYVVKKSGSVHSTLPQIPRVSGYKLKRDTGDSNPLLTDIMQTIAPEECKDAQKGALSGQQSEDCLAFTASEYPDVDKLHLVSVDSNDGLNDPNIIRLE